jgi:hypothetical protein
VLLRKIHDFMRKIPETFEKRGMTLRYNRGEDE